MIKTCKHCKQTVNCNKFGDMAKHVRWLCPKAPSRTVQVNPAKSSVNILQMVEDLTADEVRSQLQLLETRKAVLTAVLTYVEAKKV